MKNNTNNNHKSQVTRNKSQETHNSTNSILKGCSEEHFSIFQICQVVDERHYALLAKSREEELEKVGIPRYFPPPAVGLVGPVEMLLNVRLAF